MDFCDNVYASRLSLPSSYRLVIAIPNLAIIPFSIVANGLLLFSIIKTKQYRKTSCLLICFLGCSDCFMALVAQPSVAVLILRYMKIPKCKVAATTQFLIILAGHLSAMFVIAVSLDRFIHMRHPYSYKKKMTRKRSHYLIACCILFPIGISTAYTVATYYRIFVSAHIVFLLIDAVIITTIFWAYLATYVQVRAHVNSTQTLRNTPINTDSEAKKKSNKPKYALKAAKTIFYILGAVCLCYTPYVIASIIWCVIKLCGRKPNQSYEFSLYLTYVLVYLNSGLNAVIFLNGNKACRRFVKSGFKKYLPGDSITESDDVTLRETLETGDSSQMNTLSGKEIQSDGIH